MLVGNTIRLSIYARRREVEVMQLVGATNWFIRWPFMIEGLIVGLIGALIAVAILLLGKVTIVDPLSERFALVDNLNTIDFVPLVDRAGRLRDGGLGARQRSHAAPLPARLSAAKNRPRAPRLRPRASLLGVSSAALLVAGIATLAACATARTRSR